MTRLMIFAVIVIVMAVLAIQNQDATALTILGSRQTPAMPFGLLLVGAFSAGTLLTIFLYGLVGLQRPPESKYRPMGRRVPYPDSPGSTNLPPSGPSTNTASSPYATAGQSYGSTSAFVSEPSPQSTSPQSTPPQDTPPQDTPPQGTSFQNSSVQPQDSHHKAAHHKAAHHKAATMHRTHRHLPLALRHLVPTSRQTELTATHLRHPFSQTHQPALQHPQ